MSPLIREAGENAFQSSRDPRLGIIAAKLKCHAVDYESALFAPALDIGIAIPEWNPRQIVEDVAGVAAGYHVELSYEGHPEPDKADEESFELEGTTADEPIESHWNFEVLLKNYGNGHKPDPATGHMVWPRSITDATTGEKGRNPMVGIESWAAPGLIWNHNFVASKLPETLVRQLGTIAETVPGDPPALSGNRSWICVRARGRNRGNIWQCQMSWQLSGPYGYVPEMYRVV